MLTTFSQNLTLQEAFENRRTVVQINEELKRTEFDGACCKKIKLLAGALIRDGFGLLLVDRFPGYSFLLTVGNR